MQAPKKEGMAALKLIIIYSVIAIAAQLKLMTRS